jgi:hypothetical protein
MADVFVSYASEDRARVEPLAQVLLGRGWSVWWDRKIPVGKSFDRVIEEEIGRAKCVIVLWSTNSVGKEWVRTEADDAKSRGILVPAFLDDVKAPLAFRMLNGANLSNWQPDTPNMEFDKLAERVSELLGQAFEREPETRTPRISSGTRGEGKPNGGVGRFFHSQWARGALAFAVFAVLSVALLLKTRAPEHEVITPDATAPAPPAPRVLSPEPQRPGQQGKDDVDKAIRDLAGIVSGAVPGTSLAKAFYAPALGMTVAYLTPEQSASTLGVQQAGGVVMGVETGKPVAAAGLHTGDVLLSIAANKLSSEDDLRRALRGIGPGKTRFEFRRGLETRVVAIDCPDCKVD